MAVLLQNTLVFELHNRRRISVGLRRQQVRRLTKTAALEFAKQGVRVNSVSPGPIQTEMFDRTFGEGETDVKKTIATQNPVGRIGTPEEIASAGDRWREFKAGKKQLTLF